MQTRQRISLNHSAKIITEPSGQNTASSGRVFVRDDHKVLAREQSRPVEADKLIRNKELLPDVYRDRNWRGVEQSGSSSGS